MLVRELIEKEEIFIQDPDKICLNEKKLLNLDFIIDRLLVIKWEIIENFMKFSPVDAGDIEIIFYDSYVKIVAPKTTNLNDFVKILKKFKAKINRYLELLNTELVDF